MKYNKNIVVHFNNLLLLGLLLSVFSCSTKSTMSTAETVKEKVVFNNHKDEILAFQSDLNAGYMDQSTSPLSADKLKQFTKNMGHQFYEIDSTYRVVAEFDTKSISKNINFETTTDRVAVYDVYGIATFELNDKTYKLNVYQSHRLRETDEYKTHLFLPFTDMTNGVETYGGGRYLDLEIPDGNQIVIDFNKAYTPYCAYSSKYSCPIPPKENHLSEVIQVGVMYAE